MNTTFPETEDLRIRWERVQQEIAALNGDACIVNNVVNIYYLTGKIFDGYIYMPREGEPVYFVRKPIDYTDERAIFIRKPEDIPVYLKEMNVKMPENVGLEADQLTFNEYTRLRKVFSPQSEFNATALLRKVRMIKTPWEISQFRYSAIQHANAYKHIPSLFKPGMTDMEFQVEMEMNMRKHGSIGIFRTFGSNMDIFMGSVLVGGNAEAPSPNDFALGGAGSPSLPIGANGSMIHPGQAVMVDLAGNFTAYLTDMTRVYSYGKLPGRAYEAHQLSIDLHNWLMENAKPGMPCADIFHYALNQVEAKGFTANFMGTVQQAKFVGHGVGIEINELPILMARSKDILQPGMLFAFEPKFVIAEVGAVGIENTYLVTDTGLEKITKFEEPIIDLI